MIASLKREIDDRETVAGSARERARRCLECRCARYFPLNSGLRFSRNARVPSRMSSVLATRPKSVGLEPQALGERHLQALVDRLDDVAHRQSAACSPAGSRQRATSVAQLGRRHDAVDQPETMRFLRR